MKRLMIILLAGVPLGCSGDEPTSSTPTQLPEAGDKTAPSTPTQLPEVRYFVIADT